MPIPSLQKFKSHRESNAGYLRDSVRAITVIETRIITYNEW
jgi:hypothetical protein